MGFLTKEQFFKVREFETFEVATKDDGIFGGEKLKAKKLSALEYAELIKLLSQQEGNPIVQYGLWIAYALVDPSDSSKRLIDGDELSKMLGVLSPAEVLFIGSQIIDKLTGANKDGVTKEIKNSETPSLEATADLSISSV